VQKKSALWELVLVSQDRIYKVLAEVFGFASFRGDQEQVLRAVFDGQNALLLMPTGMGKSLCYQLPARIFHVDGRGLTLVISPLISLMKDQVDAAVKKGLKAAFINSSLSAQERGIRYKKLGRGDYELLYVTPERFRIAEFRESLRQNKIALLAIDEAHCISSWGHDFRPDYSRLGEYRKELGEPTTLALTATATPAVQADILLQLGLEPLKTRVFNQGVLRPELALQVLAVHGLAEKVRAVVSSRHHTPGASILYFSLIQSLREFSGELTRLGISHLTYHGQMGDQDRKRSQDAFLKSADALILATPAFGLGVDKENVRSVLHAEISGSIEAYYQEVGRAGRDGKAADCVLLYDPDDVSIQNDFIGWGNPDPGFIRAVYNLISRNLVRAQQEGFDYLRTQMNFYNRRDFRVETAVNQLERWGSIEGRQPREWQAIQDPPDEFLDQKLFDLRLKGQKRKLFEIVEFCIMEEGCRMSRIAEYFGFPNQPRCGRCDLCRTAAAIDKSPGET
jgi:ATP-dependent DNA helicase RecQ